MALTPGARLGLYEIIAHIGEGGMGQVYRATDTKLKRQVAIKILPPSLAADADRLARFQREAEVLASLNHPNIAGIYGLEESDYVTALVMELVEGEDLSQRIARGALPIMEALLIAKQIAEALEAAHEQGIIHRDLKPANIKLRSDGTVKVLDFGLAKSMDQTERSSPSMSVSPTITTPAMTQAGMILGTAAYMSPEQASQTPVDKRSDLWAFGVVLLEMLTGRPVFGGETVSHVLAAVLTKSPDWTMLPAQTPAPIRTLLRRCLEKDRKRRLADASDARLEIEEALTAPVTEVTPTMAFAWFRSARLAWTVAAGVALAALAIILPAMRNLLEAPTATRHLVKFEVVSPAGAVWSPSPNASTAQVAISPDGMRLAFVAAKRSEPSRVWIRPLDRTDAQPLAGTEGATFPFWSPEGRFVAFFAGGQLKKIAVAGGAPQTLCDVGGSPRGGAWSTSGVILFARSQSPLGQVSQEGGAVTPATRFDAAQEPIFHYWPQFLPDGKRFLYLQRSAKSEFRGIYIGSLATPETTQILATEVRGMFARGHLLFIRDGLLFAQPFDERALRLGGEPVRLADHVGFYTSSYGYAAFDASASGPVVFGPTLLSSSQLSWFDRDGHLVANGPLGVFASPRLSSDQKTVAVSVRDAQTSSDISVFDVTRGVASRVTVHPAGDSFPAWMPDGAHLLFASSRDATKSSAIVVYRKSVKGIEDEEPVNAQSPLLGYPDDVSSDGRFVLAHRLTTRGTDLVAYPLPQDGREPAVLPTPFNEVQARFSPDGKWVVYASDESGRFEVYVRPFPFSAERIPVSTAGGMQPEWRRDGKELFYISADRKMMTVSISADGTTLTPGTPRALFAVDVVAPNSPYPGDYAVSADGKRFLVNSVTDEPTRQTLTVILNWQALLKQ